MDNLLKCVSENSEISSMRVMSFIALGVGSVIAGVGLYKGSDLTGLSILVGVFVSASFGGKVSQKFFETKSKE